MRNDKHGTPPLSLSILHRDDSSAHEQETTGSMAWRRSGSALSKRLALSEEVAEALYGQHRKPVVALESTIISHGMPFPQNLEMAKTVEDLVRAQGACPATICIADGELKVGLNDTDLNRLAEMGSAARKCSTRDIAAAVTENIVGATTVSSTMYGCFAYALSFMMHACVI